ncbi:MULTISPECIES: phosphoglucomutase (alpha-D-glucose-1,6-bisphosphate-dependent) [Acetobacter]|uniref:Phosphoglucomutase n=1 Tax=Acetobacter pomorum DM001 TaxID=945681 RepID=F1YU96_9PROT|nr:MULTISPECIES: phosphoglucomutase (alpha-D-glucose-1,6-bisphosphate-dependent) [Acetobacter]ATI12283.1 alpha-D-glucose phosphate-specific phosphoglucomutase [Acetobacter pomorum]AXC25355.1 alpha-D-glucose phosphate-specific phosphoglucomutase [Acetobacter sp. JWB]EGE47535.1 Phosphoglucomutase [Acetobacter pomorum DM001]KAA8423496.1 alpha-D-glucose phosphate-specific phosphoglucomutase [Acetobacter pomorum]KAA8435312.1 alpha-D-glucose phosphate-specific phosphoglucomutase [Acetobacter pomorum
MPSISPFAGKPVDPDRLVNIDALLDAYYTRKPDPAIATQRVAFGTSGHRGSALTTSFNEKHILAISQAIADYRKGAGITGPLFIGIDTHALSRPALKSALEVFAANGVEVRIDAQDGYTPTPVISHAILTYNRDRSSDLADGVVITPSHNPPEDGGYKYNPPHGGPADTDITKVVENAANDYMAKNMEGVKRVGLEEALKAPTTKRHDYITPYVDDLAAVVDMDVIRESGVSIGIDPLGGAAVDYWQPIIDKYGINATIVSKEVDPTFRFMTADWDGKIRMDCSSPYAMARLVGMKDKFDIAFANDTDADRHGIVSGKYGLMNPNHYLAVAIEYLFKNRENWNARAGVGKTVVSSGMIDRVANEIGRKLVEVPVGFKWFVDGLYHGTLGFGGEESAGASFLRRAGTVWSTDKDGIILGLLAAEMTARTKRTPGAAYEDMTKRLGTPYYARIDAPATPEEKAILKNLSPEQIGMTELAGEPIITTLTNAPGNGAAIGGLKVSAKDGWFAARPSGTENVYKIYAESFKSEAHLKAIQTEAQNAISALFAQIAEKKAG